MEAGREVKENGKQNDLLDRIKADPEFAIIADEIDNIVNPDEFIGRAPEQVVEFLDREVKPLLKKYADDIVTGDDIKV